MLKTRLFRNGQPFLMGKNRDAASIKQMIETLFECENGGKIGKKLDKVKEMRQCLLKKLQ
jgi:hypothetical protein